MNTSPLVILGTRIAWLVLTLLDSTKRYFFINIRDNNNYPYNNLFLIVSLELPNGYTKVDTLEYQMIPDGALLGDGFSD
jgi:hypothetical protein